MSDDSIIPNIIIAGAPKCATTSLFEWMSQHPQINCSIVKETYFLMDVGYPLYNVENNYHDSGIEGYKKFFTSSCGKDKLRLEATPDYLYQKTALNFFAGLSKKPTILFVLRKPSERVYSLFNFAQNNLAIIDKSTTFTSYIESIFGQHINANYKNRFILYNAIEQSQYIDYLRKWRDCIGIENIQIILFEELAGNPRLILKDIAKRIGVSTKYVDDINFSIKNSTYSINSHKLHRAKRLVDKYISNSEIKKYLRFFYNFINKNKNKKSSRTSEDVATMEKLDVYFDNYNKQLSDEFSLCLDVWK